MCGSPDSALSRASGALRFRDLGCDGDADSATMLTSSFGLELPVFDRVTGPSTCVAGFGMTAPFREPGGWLSEESSELSVSVMSDKSSSNLLLFTDDVDVVFAAACDVSPVAIQVRCGLLMSTPVQRTIP